MLVSVGPEEGEHHVAEQVRIALLNVDAGSIDVKKLAMLSDQIVRG
jgi:hypothetical protein